MGSSSSSSCSCFLLLFIFYYLLFQSNPALSSSSSHATNSTDLIQQTCKNTKYYDLCVSALKSNASSLKADTKGLALIMIKVGINNATATNTYLSSQMLSVTTNDTSMKTVMKECADKYALASGALQNSMQDLSAEMYDYAYLDVMAASDYPNACRNTFKRYNGLAYPQELAKREDGLKHICAVVLGIINAIGF